MRCSKVILTATSTNEIPPMKTLSRNLIAGTAGILMLATAQPLFAATLVDRGLPTANLNNAAGADRSNVAWAFTLYTPTSYWLVGDNFSNTSAQSWQIDTIRVWTTGQTDTAVLWGGVEGLGLTVLSSSYVMTDSTYADASLYQTSSGNYTGIHQIDFAVNIALGAGQTFDFFLDGSGSGGVTFVPFVHSSNAARSGSTQQGADDSMLYANVVGGAIATADVGTWSSLGDGWDKPSDVNVQVIGTVPDSGSTLALVGVALVGLSLRRRRT